MNLPFLDAPPLEELFNLYPSTMSQLLNKMLPFTCIRFRRMLAQRLYANCQQQRIMLAVWNVTITTLATCVIVVSG